jgi:hypothetical protein
MTIRDETASGSALGLRRDAIGLDAAARTCRFSARRGSFEVDLPMEPMHGTVGVAPANLEAPGEVMDGAHARLRDLAGEYRSG